MEAPTRSSQNYTRFCTYDTSYPSIYEPSYDMLIVFYDEDDSDDDQDWTDFIPPLPSGSAQS